MQHGCVPTCLVLSESIINSPVYPLSILQSSLDMPNLDLNQQLKMIAGGGGGKFFLKRYKNL